MKRKALLQDDGFQMFPKELLRTREVKGCQLMEIIEKECLVFWEMLGIILKNKKHNWRRSQMTR